MQMLQVPGYSDLFGQQDLTYDDFVRDIPSEIIISFAVMFNNETKGPEESLRTQKRLKNFISARFTPEQHARLNAAYFSYFDRTKSTPYLFATRYLLAMVIREMNNYRDLPLPIDLTPEQEYQFLIAYLLIVEEANKTSSSLMDAAREHRDEPFCEYRILWLPNINQFEFSEDANPGYEVFRFLCFAKHTLQNRRPYLREYVRLHGFNSLSHLLASFNSLIQAALAYYPDQQFQHVTYIQPQDDVDVAHLDNQSINNQIGQALINIDTIRKFPLFRTSRNDYMIFDTDIYNKRPYRSAYFEFYYNTQLRNALNFNAYSSEISFDVLEKLSFRSILSSLANSKHDVIYFEDGTDNAPDGYYRYGRTIFLIEYKAYLFPATLSQNPDFEAMKEYIDRRFIANENGTPKGVSQLSRQIGFLLNNDFDFDTEYHEKLNSKKGIRIYPIICHDEFHFAMPGINEYLDDVFQSTLSDVIKDHFVVKPATLINLQHLFDMAMRGQSIRRLETFIDTYHSRVKNKAKRLESTADTNDFLKSKKSFDEMYTSDLRQMLPNIKGGGGLSPMLDFIGISQDEIDQEL